MKEKPNIDELIAGIKILKTNSDYRVNDVVNRLGARWRHSKNQIRNNPVYRDTILFKYFKRKKRGHLDEDLFLDTLFKHQATENYPTPTPNELVMHLRLGDHVEHPDFLSGDYVKLIGDTIEKNPNIDKLTIVTAFAYQVFSADSMHLKPNETSTWEYTEEKQEKNIEKLHVVLGEIIDNFDLDIGIYSNEDIDRDICYCISSSYFIKDVGRLGTLLLQLKNHRESTQK